MEPVFLTESLRKREEVLVTGSTLCVCGRWCMLVFFYCVDTYNLSFKDSKKGRRGVYRL